MHKKRRWRAHRLASRILKGRPLATTHAMARIPYEITLDVFEPKSIFAATLVIVNVAKLGRVLLDRLKILSPAM